MRAIAGPTGRDSEENAASKVNGVTNTQQPSSERAIQLIEVEADRLLAYFSRRVQPVEDAADLLGETLLVVWRRVDAVPADDEQARMWVYGIARNVLSTHRRGTVRRLALADRLRDELATEPARYDRDPQADAIRDAVRSLPLADRELIGLVHWEGFSLAETATILGKRPGTVRMRYQRARDRLRVLLDSRELAAHLNLSEAANRIQPESSPQKEQDDEPAERSALATKRSGTTAHDLHPSPPALRPTE